MANRNKMKCTVWTDSGTRMEMGTSPLMAGIDAVYDMLTHEQREEFKDRIKRSDAARERRIAEREGYRIPEVAS